MTHTAKITKGAKKLAASILSIPEQFTTPSEIIRAAKLIESLEDNPPEGLDNAGVLAFLSEEVEIELTEAQRDFLKKSIEANAKRIPPSTHSMILLTTLGFE